MHPPMHFVNLLITFQLFKCIAIFYTVKYKKNIWDTESKISSDLVFVFISIVVADL